MDNLENKAKKDELEMYKYAAAAANFFQAKDINSTRKCLDHLMKDINPKLTDEEKKGFVWNAYTDPKAIIAGVQKGVEIYNTDYKNVLESKTINEMFERYSPEFDKNLSEKEKEKAKEAFAKLGDKKYSEILEGAALLQEIINSKTTRYKKEEKEKAQKEFDKKYAPVLSAIQGYEELRINQLMSEMRKETIFENIKGYFENEEEQAEAA